MSDDKLRNIKFVVYWQESFNIQKNKFYKCLHNQISPITFVFSSYLLKAVLNLPKTILDT